MASHVGGGVTGRSLGCPYLTPIGGALQSMVGSSPVSLCMSHAEKLTARESGDEMLV
jgi:hypothetical protein